MYFCSRGKGDHDDDSSAMDACCAGASLVRVLIYHNYDNNMIYKSFNRSPKLSNLVAAVGSDGTAILTSFVAS